MTEKECRDYVTQKGRAFAYALTIAAREGYRMRWKIECHDQHKAGKRRITYRFRSWGWGKE